MIGNFGSLFGSLQGIVLWLLVAASFVVKIYAFVDALRHKTPLYPAAGKRSKNFWLALTGVSLAIQVVILNPLSLLNIVGFVASAVYLADVRPALREITGRGGSSGGPYGGW